MLNERNKANKAKKSKWEDERDELDDQGIEAADADRKRRSQRQHADRYKDHPHGTYGEKRGVRREPARKVGSITMTGRTGTTATDTKEPRLVDRQGKRRKVATELLKNKSTTAGPKGKLPDHTVYHDMGMLMAESLGLVSESQERRARDSGVGSLVNRRPRTSGPPERPTEYEKKLARQTAQQTPAERAADVQDVYTRAGQKRRAQTGKRRYVAAMAKDDTTKVTIKPAKKGPKQMSGRRRAR
jgi:hypothetical protein